VEWPDLGQPTPRDTIRPHQPVQWPHGSALLLSSSPPDCEASAVTLLRSRRTARHFSAVAPADLSAWFDLSCRVQQRQASGLGFDLTRRPAPSAGAIHPIHVVLAWPQASAWHRYDPLDHALRSFHGKADPREAHASLQQVLAAPHAALVLLAAEVGRTQAKYEHAASLVWRDAGALLATMALAAQAVSLAFCPLGVTGEPWASGLLEEDGLVGVGAAFVGRPG
jgi:SagB-type dehydrogenase family enzyme